MRRDDALAQARAEKSCGKSENKLNWQRENFGRPREGTSGSLTRRESDTESVLRRVFYFMATKSKLTERDFQEAARRLRCDVAAIRAVAEVESRGAGFYPDGFPVILFERHKFYKYCDPARRAEWARLYPRICNPKKGGYGKAGKNQRDKFNLAFSLDPEAAMMACSWGKFQVMGFNYEELGYQSIHEFVDRMKQSEGEHLEAFVRFVLKNNLADEIRAHRWEDFARCYNGQDYRENDYHIKLPAAYEKYKSQSAPPPANPTGNPPATLPAVLRASEGTESTSAPASTAARIGDSAKPGDGKEKVAVEKPKSKSFFEKMWAKISGVVTGNALFDGFSEKASQAQALGMSARFWATLGWLLLFGSVTYLFYEWYKDREERRRELEITEALIRENSAPDNYVQLVDSEKLDEYRARGYKIITR